METMNRAFWGISIVFLGLSTFAKPITDDDWSALGAGVNYYVFSLACDSGGNLYAGGMFSCAGDTDCVGIAKWDGNAWSALGSGICTPGPYNNSGGT